MTNPKSCTITASTPWYRVHVWTIDVRDDMHTLIDWGVDGIVTDRPDLLREVLQARGMWASSLGT